MSPKKQVKEDTIKLQRPPQTAVPVKAMKHALEQEESKIRTANYTASGKSIGQSQHGSQDIKRRRTDEDEDKEIITSKPMRVSVVKQVFHLFFQL